MPGASSGEIRGARATLVLVTIIWGLELAVGPVRPAGFLALDLPDHLLRYGGRDSDGGRPAAGHQPIHRPWLPRAGIC